MSRRIRSVLSLALALLALPAAGPAAGAALGAGPKGGGEGVIVFERLAGDGWTINAMKADGTGARVWRSDANRSARFPSIAANRSKLAFVAARGDATVLVADYDSGAARVPFRREERTLAPSISGDGSELAFVSWLPGRDPEIWIGDADGSNARQLTRNNLLDAEPALSANGRRIAFVRGIGGPVIFTMDRDGRNAKAVTGDAYDGARQPAISPNGRRIAFSAYLDGAWRIVTIDADGSDRRTVAVGEQPAFSPDGDQLAFVRDSQIWRMDLDGTDQVALTRGGRNLNPSSEPVAAPLGPPISWPGTPPEHPAPGPSDALDFVGPMGPTRSNAR